jgi:hypothetical protein
MMAMAIICRDPRSWLRRTSQSGRAQHGLIDAAPGTTSGQLALDDHRGNRTDAEPLGTLGHLDVSHVVNDHLARGASGVPDDLDCFMAGRASGTEHFDLSLGSHRLDANYAGSATAERQPMAARWQTLPLGGTSQVKREVAGLKRETECAPRSVPVVVMHVGHVRV